MRRVTRDQDLDPETRWSPQQALQHPFLTGQRFSGPFQPQTLQPPYQAPHGANAAAHDTSALLYHSPMAAMLATSPEFHAQAHAAAMAAVQVGCCSAAALCWGVPRAHTIGLQ